MTRRVRRLEAEIGVFVRQYGRKHYPGWDPNDRHYSRKTEKIVRRMSPEDLDTLLRDDPDDIEDLSGGDTVPEKSKVDERPRSSRD